MMLWDLAGSKEFDKVRAAICAVRGCVVICDLTRPETLAACGDMSTNCDG